MSAPTPRAMPLFTEQQRAKLLANGAASIDDPRHDSWPVVKLRTADGYATWLVIEIDPEFPHITWAFGKVGDHFVFEKVSIRDLEDYRSNRGLSLEADGSFVSQGPIWCYFAPCIEADRIVDPRPS